MHFLNFFLILCNVGVISDAFKLPRSYFLIQKKNDGIIDKELSKSNIRTSTALKMLLIPQIGFIATCVGTVVAYIYFNIDDIRNKQKIVIEKTMTEQTNVINSAQEKQRAAIEKIKKEQEDNVLKAKQNAEEAKRRADEATRRR